MKTIIISTLVLFLSGCAFVSKEIHPELTFRENPFVEITAHDSWFTLQAACFRQHKTFDIYMGCALVPIDPKQKCMVNVMRNDAVSLQHELKHCRGFGDTPFFWMAQ